MAMDAHTKQSSKQEVVLQQYVVLHYVVLGQQANASPQDSSLGLDPIACLDHIPRKASLEAHMVADAV